jgi:Family of unknown function (DUF6586)
MSSPRARANEKLYHARILANSWREQLAAQVIPASVLQGAFADATRQQLQLAYGWFLLEISQPSELPPRPPAHSGELPEIAPGKALPGQIHELRQMEHSGWLADVLDPQATQAMVVKNPQSLALSAPRAFGPDQIDTWIDQLSSLFEHMTDSLDEY